MENHSELPQIPNNPTNGKNAANLQKLKGDDVEPSAHLFMQAVLQ